jgi:S1-C subfamily serine protease
LVIFGYFWLFLVISVWAIRLTSCFVYKVGTSKDLKVGQTCYALGAGDAGVSNLKGTNTTASFRQQATMSAGVVSGLRRSVPSKNATTIRGAIQTVRDVYIFIFIS